jgi:hypothetical protein
VVGHAKPIVPDDFDQVAAAAAENVEIAGMRIAPERLLHLQSQAVHAATHVRMTHRQPDADARGNRDHPRSADSTRRSVVAPMSRLPNREKKEARHLNRLR